MTLEPRTATGRKLVAIHGASLLDDVLGIEAEAGTLDEAWAAAEAALPEGWQIRGVTRAYLDDRRWRCWALDVSPNAPRKTPIVDVTADSPTAALRALARRLHPSEEGT